MQHNKAKIACRCYLSPVWCIRQILPKMNIHDKNLFWPYIFSLKFSNLQSFIFVSSVYLFLLQYTFKPLDVLPVIKILRQWLLIQGIVYRWQLFFFGAITTTKTRLLSDIARPFPACNKKKACWTRKKCCFLTCTFSKFSYIFFI